MYNKRARSTKQAYKENELFITTTHKHKKIVVPPRTAKVIQQQHKSSFLQFTHARTMIVETFMLRFRITTAFSFAWFELLFLK